MADRFIPVDVSQLVERARAGEPAAFRELFRLHLSRVHRIVHRMAGASSDVDDLVQTVFVEGFRSLPSFRGESLFSTWLGRIAVRVSLRAKKRPALMLVPLDVAGDQPSQAQGPHEDASAREGLRRLDALLAALRPKKRAAFVLHALEGYSIEETAAMVGASVAAVKVRIHDARRELERRALKDPYFSERVGAKEPR
ncbi:MAG: polymerase sigma factor RpoE [Myxococcales bacterium]|nr:polymerase sigma factor RpoE [Myxococcales bacterium]